MSTDTHDYWHEVFDWCIATTSNVALPASTNDLVALDAEDVAGRHALADLIKQRRFDHQQIVSRDHATHATGSALVVSSRGVLLHFHKKFERWLQPGGHVELNETAMQGAVRETIEETGVLARHPGSGPLLLSVDDHPAGAHRHIDLLYLLVSPPTEPAPAAGESPLVKWFEIDKALNFLDFKDEPRIPHNLARAQAWCDANQLPE